MGILTSKSLRKSGMLITCLSLFFFHAVIFVPDTCAQSAPPAAPQATGPIDIQATEQDFADDVVIAKGNVRVKYKDSTILAPQATLYRDQAGQPQKAIFTGHPTIINSDSTMIADTIIFEIANSKIIAQGHAHSEVISKGDTDMDITPKSASKAKNGKQPFKWPQAGDENDATAAKSDDSGAPEVAKEEGQESTGSDTATGDSTASHSTAAPKKTGKNAPAEKIITDSETQEYDKMSGHFDAIGHVHCIHTDMSVFSEKLQLVYGTDSKPETALFTGHVSAFQGKNNTQADMVTYYLTTKRLQATGNVHSKVIQEKPPESKDGKKTDSNKKVVGMAPGPGAADAATPAASTAQTAKKTTEDDTVLIVSDAQDYSKETGLMTADGNVRCYNQDTIGMGQKAVMIRTPDGQAQKVIFSGRSQITQPGKRWIADKITFICATKKVLAEGNTRAYILQQNQNDSKHTSTGVASKPNSSTAISTSKVEATR
jgi:lipopolysaccharide assembly outer membrane protein LptD (OstA)